MAQMGGGHTPPVPMTPTQFSSTVAGQTVQIAVRVKSINRSTLYTELLQHETGTLSKPTGKPVVVFFPSGTPVIMGRAADVTPGSVLFIYGVLTKPGYVDAKRLVVDSKYVKVDMGSAARK